MQKGICLAALVVIFAAPRLSVAQQTQQPGQTQSSAQSKTQASQAQTAKKPDPLVEAARKAREAKKNESKPAVFTNDNIPTTPGGVSVVGNTAVTSSGSAEEKASSGKSSSAGKNDEATWRKKFAEARHKLEQDQNELSILQRESNQLQLQYYPDPTKALMQSVDRSDIVKKQKAIEDKQKQIDADQQAISALEDELRKAGGDPGWARE
ncbi:MAG TPA: hypothetical protein VGU63_01985 [Candidatus Acidoferrales bacterium]|nr:hypothetical protein [Candidatus Acidoferrales bacterium]